MPNTPIKENLNSARVVDNWTRFRVDPPMCDWRKLDFFILTNKWIFDKTKRLQKKVKKKIAKLGYTVSIVTQIVYVGKYHNKVNVDA